ncbi:MAG: hypothetical protein LBI04_09640 [Treponema sp.]|jgi:hypothetical protein|nr:hypothetical protein [Treponema sp.]
MADNINLDVLSTRNGFNTAVRYIKNTIGIASSAGADNLGDILFKLDDEEITSAKIGLILRMLLVDKLGYKTASTNLDVTVDDLAPVAKEFSKWNGVDLVAAYHHPELGLLIANPKVAEELADFGGLRKRELLVIYAGFYGQETNENCEKAASLALRVFEGAKVTVPSALAKGKYTVKKVSKPKKAAEPKPAKVKTAAKTEIKRAAPVIKTAAPQVKPAGGPSRMTPRYAVVVQNELFHNGNVEAWKRIIASYKAKHPDLEVFIYYERERILDINSLFKWGKVKHGSAIEFAVAGNNIEDVAKLQRYLAQGASHQFEAFLRGPVNTVLKLF